MMCRWKRNYCRGAVDFLADSGHLLYNGSKKVGGVWHGMDEAKREELAVRAAQLYYGEDYSQQRVAEALGTSRPSVSRLLQFAKQNGYVEIRIHDPAQNMDRLAAAVQQRFQLKAVQVASSGLDDENEIKKYIGQKAAEYLDTIVQPNDILGISWGTTMHHVARALRPKALPGVQVVQLKGGASHTQGLTYAHEILERFAQNFSAQAHYLPLPVIFDTREVKEMVDADRYIHSVLALGRQANIALFTVGTVRDSALLFQLGYPIAAKVKAEIKQQAVGDICSRFFTAQGEICNAEVDARTVGIRLAELGTKEYSILVAGGQPKYAGIKAALAGGYANVLVTDQYTARRLLEDVNIYEEK